MGPFGIPWIIAVIYFLGCIGVPIMIEIVLHLEWWKESSEYYYSFNEEKEQ